MIGKFSIGSKPIASFPAVVQEEIWVYPSSLVVNTYLDTGSLTATFLISPSNLVVTSYLDAVDITKQSSRTWGPAMQNG